MARRERRWMVAALIAAALVGAGCSAGGGETRPPNQYRDMGVERDLAPPEDGGAGPAGVRADRLFPTEANPKVEFGLCVWASPLRFDSAERGTEVIVAGGDGRVVALDPVTGQPRWELQVPTPEGEAAVIVATPALVDGLLVVGYHTTPQGEEPLKTPRMRHQVAVVDLEAGALAEGFEEPVEIEGSFAASSGDGEVPFRPSNALGRARIAHGRLPGDVLGKVYVTFGNARDIQPWHGFAFEVDLDRWKAQGAAAAITGSLVTTPEADCGAAGQSGSRERICGGGLWAPSGPLVLEEQEGYSLILAPGNGQLDLERGDFANTLMRVGPGLDFDPGCDPQACSGFDPDDPSLDCLESCKNLFVPRRRPEDGPLEPESGVCQGLTMFECWEKLDYIGGSTPAAVTLPDSGRRVLVYPTKDGAVYMVDADHLGTLLDREQLVAVCGTANERCRWDWAGMIVTQPAQFELDGRPVLLVATFMPDTVHPAGVVALQVTEEGGVPGLEVLWQAPNFASDEAIARFRQHPTRIALQSIEGQAGPVAWVAETFRNETGRLLGIRAWDGAILEDRPLAGPGMRFVEPLVIDDKLYLSSCSEAGVKAFIEGYRLVVEEK